MSNFEKLFHDLNKKENLVFSTEKNTKNVKIRI